MNNIEPPLSSDGETSNLSGMAVTEFFVVFAVFVAAMLAFGRAGVVTSVLMFLTVFVPCFVVAVLVSRLIPRYRKLPYADLVRRTTRIVAVVGVLMVFGLWYAQRH